MNCDLPKHFGIAESCNILSALLNDFSVRVVLKLLWNEMKRSNGGIEFREDIFKRFIADRDYAKAANYIFEALDVDIIRESYKNDKKDCDTFFLEFFQLGIMQNNLNYGSQKDKSEYSGTIFSLFGKYFGVFLTMEHIQEGLDCNRDLFGVFGKNLKQSENPYREAHIRKFMEFANETNHYNLKQRRASEFHQFKDHLNKFLAVVKDEYTRAIRKKRRNIEKMKMKTPKELSKENANEYMKLSSNEESEESEESTSSEEEMEQPQQKHLTIEETAEIHSYLNLASKKRKREEIRYAEERTRIMQQKKDEEKLRNLDSLLYIHQSKNGIENSENNDTSQELSEPPRKKRKVIEEEIGEIDDLPVARVLQFKPVSSFSSNSQARQVKRGSLGKKKKKKMKKVSKKRKSKRLRSSQVNNNSNDDYDIIRLRNFKPTQKTNEIETANQTVNPPPPIPNTKTQEPIPVPSTNTGKKPKRIKFSMIPSPLKSQLYIKTNIQEKKKKKKKKKKRSLKISLIPPNNHTIVKSPEGNEQENGEMRGRNLNKNLNKSTIHISKLPTHIDSNTHGNGRLKVEAMRLVRFDETKFLSMITSTSSGQLQFLRSSSKSKSQKKFTTFPISVEDKHDKILSLCGHVSTNLVGNIFILPYTHKKKHKNNEKTKPTYGVFSVGVGRNLEVSKNWGSFSKRYECVAVIPGTNSAFLMLSKTRTKDKYEISVFQRNGNGKMSGTFVKEKEMYVGGRIKVFKVFLEGVQKFRDVKGNGVRIRCYICVLREDGYFGVSTLVVKQFNSNSDLKLEVLDIKKFILLDPEVNSVQNRKKRVDVIGDVVYVRRKLVDTEPLGLFFVCYENVLCVYFKFGKKLVKKLDTLDDSFKIKTVCVRSKKNGGNVKKTMRNMKISEEFSILLLVEKVEGNKSFVHEKTVVVNMSDEYVKRNGEVGFREVVIRPFSDRKVNITKCYFDKMKFSNDVDKMVDEEEEEEEEEDLKGEKFEIDQLVIDEFAGGVELFMASNRGELIQMKLSD